MLEKDQKNVWKARAATYNNLKWVNNDRLKEAIVKYGEFKSDHIVLDAGTGTGAIALAIEPHIKEIHGIDISSEMLSFIPKKSRIIKKEGSILKMEYPDDMFDRITARNVFHNILEESDRRNSVKECLRTLKKGGKFILQEGVPPHSSLKKDFEKIFSLKEERTTFTVEEMADILKDSGFIRIETHVISDPDFDLNNWLDNDGTLDEETKTKIIALHANSSDNFKKHYNLRNVNGKVIIDTNSAIVIGEKP
jgi:ubiquinone/menaquinone biosynthesis C-methylase UbiE